MSERGRTEFRATADRDLLVPGLRHIGWSQFVEAKPHALNAHVHPGAYELCYIARGSLSWWVGAERFEVGPGDCFLTRPDERHGGENGVMDPCELYWVSFALDGPQSGLGLPPDEAAAIDAALRATPGRTCPGPQHLAEHYDRILAELAAPGELSPTVVRSALALLLGDAVRAYHGQDASARRHGERTRLAIEWMRRHLAEDLALEDVAAAVDLRPSHFRKTFRAETGFSPQEYLTNLRLAAAKRLLATTDASVTDIALRSGFNSSAWFSTAFKKHTGFSPREWRRRERA